MTYASGTGSDFGQKSRNLLSGNGTSLCPDFGIPLYNKILYNTICMDLQVKHAFWCDRGGLVCVTSFTDGPLLFLWKTVFLNSSLEKTLVKFGKFTKPPLHRPFH